MALGKSRIQLTELGRVQGVQVSLGISPTIPTRIPQLCVTRR